MKRLVFAALLVAALGLAYQAWTRGIREPQPPGSVLLWDVDVGEIESVRYEADGGRLVIEREEDEMGEFFWASLLLAAPESSASSSPAPVEFLVGEEGERLLNALASPEALRDLGIVEEQQGREYRLDPAIARLTLNLRRAQRQLDVGTVDTESGGRYVREIGSGRVYVIPAPLVGVIEAANRALPELRPHAFLLAQVAKVVVRTSRGERTMTRSATSTPTEFTWTPAPASDQPDPNFSSFMDLLWQLWIVEYRPGLSPDRLTSILRIEYFDAEERRIGWLEFYEGPRDLETTYYVRTELSRVPATVVGGLGERVHQEVLQLF